MLVRTVATFSLILLVLCPWKAVADVTVFDNGGPYDAVAIAEGGMLADVDHISFIEAADDFSLMAGSNTFNQVQWWGIYGSGTTPATDDFTLSIYADSSGSPGGLVQSLGINSVQRENSGLFNGVSNLPVYEYTAYVGNTTLAAGTSYWLGISNDSGGNNWAWVLHDPFTGNARVYSSQNMSFGVGQNSELSFNLKFDNSIPEPSTIGILAIVAVFGCNRRRRAKADR